MASSRYLELLLARRDALSVEERAILRAIPVERRTFIHDERIVTERAAPEGACLLVRGMAMRVHRVGRIERVISALHVAGDFVDLHAFLLSHMDHDMGQLAQFFYSQTTGRMAHLKPMSPRVPLCRRTHRLRVHA